MAQVKKLLGAAGRAVAVILLAAACFSAEAGDDQELDALFALLRQADRETAREIEMRIARAWSESGSPSMNLLLAKGRKAMAEGRHLEAIRHLSALVDHAPDFAEGWNARATAYYLIGQHELSLNDIGRTLMLEPRHFGAISGYAMIMEAWGNDAAALKAHELVYEMYPMREGLAETIARLRKKTSGHSI